MNRRPSLTSTVRSLPNVSWAVPAMTSGCRLTRWSRAGNSRHFALPPPLAPASDDHNPPFAMFCRRLDQCLLWAGTAPRATPASRPTCDVHSRVSRRWLYVGSGRLRTMSARSDCSFSVRASARSFFDVRRSKRAISGDIRRRGGRARLRCAFRVGSVSTTRTNLCPRSSPRRLWSTLSAPALSS